jgi:hypothetical protein
VRKKIQILMESIYPFGILLYMDEPNCRKRESLLLETSKKNMGTVGATFLLLLFSVFISLPGALAARYSFFKLFSLELRTIFKNFETQIMCKNDSKSNIV